MTMTNALRQPCSMRTVGFLVIGLLIVHGVVPAEATAGADENPKPAAKPAEAKKAPAGANKTPNAEYIQRINERLAEKWQANKLTQSVRCTDYEFIRRASLDLIGRVATPKEVAQFLKDPPDARRAALIERL